jgi:hypothetical protein
VWSSPNLIGAALIVGAIAFAVVVLRSETPAIAEDETDAEGQPSGTEPAYSEAA